MCADPVIGPARPDLPARTGKRIERGRILIGPHGCSGRRRWLPELDPRIRQAAAVSSSTLAVPDKRRFAEWTGLVMGW